MSAHQGNSACRITVDPLTADVLRLEAKKVLMFNHEPFEDFLDYVPTKQLALADIFRDATAVIDALHLGPRHGPTHRRFEVPLTAGHIHQLHKRRCDLLDTNLDLLETSAPTTSQRPSWPTSTPTAAASKPSTASSTPTATRSRHSPSHLRCGVLTPQRVAPRAFGRPAQTLVVLRGVVCRHRGSEERGCRETLVCHPLAPGRGRLRRRSH